MIGWRIYYGDGSTYASDKGCVEDAPTRDVQVIVLVDGDTGWYMQSGSDYYVWTGTRWLGVDQFGLYDYLLQPGWKKVLFGRTIDNETYRTIYQRAKSDPGLPAKSAYKRGERQP